MRLPTEDTFQVKQYTVRKMRAVLLLLPGALAVGSFDPQFQQWAREYARFYQGRSLSELYPTWLANKKIVDQINSEQLSWTAGLGVYAGFTQEEFEAKILLPQSKVISNNDDDVKRSQARAGVNVFLGFRDPRFTFPPWPNDISNF